MNQYKIKKFPKTRIATIDVCATGRQKHHISAMIELDVSESRKKIKAYKKLGRISFTAWLLKVIGHTIQLYPEVAAYLQGKRKIVLFDDVNISLIVEKNVNGTEVPIPLIIEQADKKSIETITEQINQAREVVFGQGDVVLQKPVAFYERLYFHLPGFLRRFFWRLLIKFPHTAFSKMGNVAVTSIGLKGNLKGWFIPLSIHPVCFGIGTITKKPLVVNNLIEIREVIHMTVLIDHDVVDGIPMARFLNKLSENIEKGLFL